MFFTVMLLMILMFIVCVIAACFLAKELNCFWYLLLIVPGVVCLWTSSLLKNAYDMLLPPWERALTVVSAPGQTGHPIIVWKTNDESYASRPVLPDELGAGLTPAKVPSGSKLYYSGNRYYLSNNQ